MKILRIADPAAGGSGTPETPEQKIKRLESELAGYKSRETEAVEREKEIAEKMEKGLTRDQAVAVIKRQKDHDAAIEAQWAGRRPEIIGVLKTVSNPREQRKQINELFPGIVTLEEIKAAKKAMTAAK